MYVVILLSYIWRVFKDTEHNGRKRKQALKKNSSQNRTNLSTFLPQKVLNTKL